MPGLGVFVNIITVLVGGTIGTIAGDRVPLHIREGVVKALGLGTVIIGLSGALSGLGKVDAHGGFLGTYGIIVFAGSLIVGTLIGELARLEYRLERFGEKLSTLVRRIPFFAQASSSKEHANVQEEKNKKNCPDLVEQDVADSPDLVEGFMVASLLFCVGAMTILGSIQDGLGNPQTLFLKALLDGFMALFFASSLGPGVMLSVVPILIIQGGIAALSFVAGAIVPEVAIVGIEMTGGVLIAAVGFNFLLTKRLPVGNMLPAILISAALCWIMG
jgi:uncharacterized membrane protein YqgA involved in biofilm formation